MFATLIRIANTDSIAWPGCTLCKTSDIFDDSYHDLGKRSDFLDDTNLLRYRILGKEDLDADQIILLPARGESLLIISSFLVLSERF